MALKFRKKILLAKIESSYGTDAVPTGAANAIQTKNLTISPLEGATVSRDLDRSTLGNDLSIHIGTHVMIEFDVEYAGSGTNTTPPAYGPLKRMCAQSETVGVSDVQYAPVSTGEESGSLYMHLDGQKHALLGARGTESLKVSTQGIPMLHYKMTGLWVDPAAVADPTPDFTAFQTPLAVTNSNTPTFSLHGYSGNLLEFNFDQASEVKYRNVVGEESVQIVDRAPVGSIVIEAPPLGTKNFFTIARANTLGALQIIHGVGGGNICQFDGASVQVLRPTYGESDGIRTLNMQLAFIPSSSGDDDYLYTTK